MKILVLGGTHGNEPLGPKLVAELKKRPIPNVKAIIANPRALQANQRFTQQDLNRSFPGNKQSLVYEERRAAKLVALCQNFDVVLDFHNTLCDDNDCVFIGQTASPILLNIASWLNLKRVIVADYDCINKYAQNCISLEISVTSKYMDIAIWRTYLEELACATALPSPLSLEFFKYVTTVTTQQRKKFGLNPSSLKVFEPIKKSTAAKLGITVPAYPIFVGKNYTSGVFAGILTRLEP